jgi:hypothetical protein
MRMLPSGGGQTRLPMRGSEFGRGFQQRTVEELVKHDQRLDRDPKPPRRGCGCAALPVVAICIAIVAATS